MPSTLKITFNSLIQPKTGACVIFVGDDLVIPSGLKKLIGTSAANALARAMTAENFKGKEKAALTLLAPPNMVADRLIVIGTGTAKDREKTTFLQQLAPACDLAHRVQGQDQHSIRLRRDHGAPCTRASFKNPSVTHRRITLWINKPFVAKLSRKSVVVHR